MMMMSIRNMIRRCGVYNSCINCVCGKSTDVKLAQTSRVSASAGGRSTGIRGLDDIGMPYLVYVVIACMYAIVKAKK